MKKLLMIASVGLGLGFSAASFAWPVECNRSCSLAEYYCNVAFDNQQCRNYVWECRACSGGVWI